MEDDGTNRKSPRESFEMGQKATQPEATKQAPDPYVTFCNRLFPF
jgi:hypothetical protein